MTKKQIIQQKDTKSKTTTMKKPKSKSSLKRERQKEKILAKEQSILISITQAKEKYLQEEKQLLEKLKKDSKQRMLFQALDKGTIQDKVRALSVLIQENPWHSLDFLNRLSRLIHNKNNKTKLMVNQEIKELFKGPLKEMLDKSKPFVELQTDSEYKDEPAKLYLISTMRHHLRKLLNSVNKNLKENLSFFKTEYIEILAELARVSESKCVECYEPLINKIGDSEARVGVVAAKYVTLGIMYQAQSALLIVQRIHLKIMSSDTDSQLAYLACLANVDYGKVEDKNVLYKALEVFLQTSQKNMEKLTKKVKQNVLEKTSTVIRQVTRGINRLLPHIKNFRQVSEFFQKYMNSFFRMAHIMPERTRIQILIFIFQIVKEDMYSDLAERFMSLLYSTLLNNELMASSLSEQYFDLLFSALTEDYHEVRILAFMKRLFLTGMHCSSRVILTILVFFGRLLKEKPILKNLLTFKEEGDKPVGKILQKISPKWKNVEEGVEVVKTGNLNEDSKPDTEELDIETDPKKEEKIETDVYAPLKRNPKFCGADKTSLWELVFLTEHYHYLVRKFSRMILNNRGQEIEYKGNPMIDFSRGSVINRLMSRQIKQVFLLKCFLILRVLVDKPNQKKEKLEDGRLKKVLMLKISKRRHLRMKISLEFIMSRRS
jgi:ribosome biogenesis protein MAK21